MEQDHYTILGYHGAIDAVYVFRNGQELVVFENISRNEKSELISRLKPQVVAGRISQYDSQSIQDTLNSVKIAPRGEVKHG